MNAIIAHPFGFALRAVYLAQYFFGSWFWKTENQSKLMGQVWRVLFLIILYFINYAFLEAWKCSFPSILSLSICHSLHFLPVFPGQRMSLVYLLFYLIVYHIVNKHFQQWVVLNDMCSFYWITKFSKAKQKHWWFSFLSSLFPSALKLHMMFLQDSNMTAGIQPQNR